LKNEYGEIETPGGMEAYRATVVKQSTMKFSRREKRLKKNFTTIHLRFMMNNIRESVQSYQFEMTRVFYGAFLLSLATTFSINVLVFTSDFLARHEFILVLLPFTSLTLTLCAIIAGISVIFKGERGKRPLDIMALFFSILHILFVGYILFSLLI
jgi:hypothetical protein